MAVILVRRSLRTPLRPIRRRTTFGVDVCPAGPYFPTMAVNDASAGTVAWTTPENAKLSDNVYASAMTVTQDTQRLNLTGFNFQIVPTKQIDGILVEVEASVVLGTSTVLCRIITNGSVSATTRSNTWSTTEQFVSYGGSTDLWGEVWTPDLINAANFGVSVRQESAIVSTLSCDSARITVYCSDPVGRTTKNIHSFGLGIQHGIGFGMPAGGRYIG